MHPITALRRWRASHARRWTRGTWQRPARATRTHLRTDPPQWTVTDSCRLGHAPLAATRRDSRTITAAGSLPARWPRAVPDLGDDERLHPPTPPLQSRAITATACSRLFSASIQGDCYCLAPPQLIAFHCTNHCTVGEDRRRSNSRRRAAGGKDVDRKST